MALESDGLLRAPVLRVVAEPATIFLVPIPLAGLNIAVSVVCMMLLIVFFKVSPLLGFALMFLNHILLAHMSTKDKHIANRLQCMGKPLRRSKNLIPARGPAKLLP